MLLIDVQGTLIDDIHRMPFDGSCEFIHYLNKHNIPFVVVTNNTKYPSHEFLHYLQNLGFAIYEHQYLDPLMILKHRVATQSIYALGSEAFCQTLVSMGFDVNSQKPHDVVVGLKDDLVYQDLADVTEKLLDGANLIGMHETALYAKHGRRYPGLGPLLRCLESATGKKATIVGKPSYQFYEEARRLLGNIDFSEITIISDDPKGDLVGAKLLGMKTVFVLSGKYQKEEEILPFMEVSLQPDLVIKSIVDYKDFI